jgi:glycosyltransferase involved in cell wall biosynthesis
MSGAIATIYVPVDEDFGMSPVESLAAGKPVIGVAEGGLLETLVDGETGLLLPPDFTVDHLVRAVEHMSTDRAALMRQACEQSAQRFTRARFLDGMRRLVNEQSRRG